MNLHHVIQEEFINLENTDNEDDANEILQEQQRVVNVIENEEKPTADNDEVVFVGSSKLNPGVFVDLKKVPVFGKFAVHNLSKQRNKPNGISAKMAIFQFDWNLERTDANDMRALTAALRPQPASKQLLINALLQEIINSQNDRRPSSSEEIIDDVISLRKLFSTQAPTDREVDLLSDIEAEIIRELSKPASMRSFSNLEEKSLPEIIQQYNRNPNGSYMFSFDFYKRLLPRQWFSNLHLEVFASLLLGFSSNCPRVNPSLMASGRQFTILPPTLFTLAVEENIRTGRATVNYERAAWVFDRRHRSRVKYEGPYRFKKGVDHIMCPFNRYGNHWALMIIDGPDHTIAYADSKWSDGTNMLRIMLYFLGQMAANCTESNYTDTPDWLRHFDAQEWTLYDLGDKLIPQQDNCDDCGVFLCMIMTIYMHMKPPYCILSEDSGTPFKRSVEGFRRKMIRLFFDFTIDTDTFEDFLDNC
jgi:hypothetical protein